MAVADFLSTSPVGLGPPKASGSPGVDSPQLPVPLGPGDPGPAGTAPCPGLARRVPQAQLRAQGWPVGVHTALLFCSACHRQSQGPRDPVGDKGWLSGHGERRQRDRAGAPSGRK